MKSIIFNDEMVRAVLSGKKTVTRRPITNICKDWPTWSTWGKSLSLPSIKVRRKGKDAFAPAKAPFKVGEVVYMRECFAKLTSHPLPKGTVPETYLYRADCGKNEIKEVKWTPSIHMSENDSRVKMAYY